MDIYRCIYIYICVEMGWFDTFYPLSQLFRERRRGVT
jgi:hypothetical protein